MDNINSKLTNTIKLKKWDNCYTFMLKLLGIFDNFKELESDEFVTLFEHDYNIKDLKSGDVIVLEYVDKDSDEAYTYRYNELAEGILLSNKVLETLHFLVVSQDKYVIDLTFEDQRNCIRIRKMDTCLDNIDKTRWKLYKLLIK